MNTILITGAGRGIGIEMTKQLLEAGNHVIAWARSPQKSTLLSQLKSQYPQKLEIYPIDITSDAQVSEFLRQHTEKKPIDILINNAGIYGEDRDFETLSLNDVLHTIETNSLGPMRVTKALLPFLQMSTNPKVIHITSLMGSIEDNESGGSYGYRMSKAALNMFHKSFSIDYSNIISLVIHPGWVKTDMGGPNAPTTPCESVQGILKIISAAKKSDSGKFISYSGEILPW